MFKAIVQSWNFLQISFMRISANIPSKFKWNETSTSVSSSNMHMDILTDIFRKQSCLCMANITENWMNTIFPSEPMGIEPLMEIERV